MEGGVSKFWGVEGATGGWDSAASTQMRTGSSTEVNSDVRFYQRSGGRGKKEECRREDLYELALCEKTRPRKKGSRLTRGRGVPLHLLIRSLGKARVERFF